MEMYFCICIIIPVIVHQFECSFFKIIKLLDLHVILWLDPSLFSQKHISYSLSSQIDVAKICLYNAQTCLEQLKCKMLIFFYIEIYNLIFDYTTHGIY